MTLMVWVNVRCDHPDCLAWDHVGGGGPNAVDARVEAALVGWLNKGRADYCPQHHPP